MQPLNEELSDLLTSMKGKFQDGLYWIRDHPVETGIIVLDIASAAVVAGKIYYGDSKVGLFAHSLLNDAFPHILLGISGVTTAYYALRRLEVGRELAILGGILTNAPIYVREAVQQLSDTVNDSIETATGIVIGIGLYYLIIERYLHRDR